MKVNINDEIIIEGSKNKSLPRIRSKATDVIIEKASSVIVIPLG